MKSSGLVLDLSNLNTNRFFVLGELCGDYEKLINVLYNQNFCKKDTLITTGNNIDLDKEKSIDCLYFLFSNHNTYSVKGKKEFELLNKKNTPEWLNQELIQYISDLPLVIKINDFLYVVNSGVEPGKKLDEQNPEVFYNIGKYDADSRFYQFENPSKKSWYDFDFISNGRLERYCFGGYGTGTIKHPAGYDLGRGVNDSPIKLIIIDKSNPDSIILVEE